MQNWMGQIEECSVSSAHHSFVISFAEAAGQSMYSFYITSKEDKWSWSLEWGGEGWRRKDKSLLILFYNNKYWMINYCWSHLPTCLFTTTSPQESTEKKLKGRQEGRDCESISSTSSLGHGLLNRDYRHTHTLSLTHTGVTSAVDRPCHTAVSAGAGRHRCSQRGPSPPVHPSTLGRVQNGGQERHGDRKSVFFST